MIVALPGGHALARRDTAIAMKDLANETFIVYAHQSGPAFYEATMAACVNAGFRPRLGQEAPRVTLGTQPRSRRFRRVHRPDLNKTHGDGRCCVPRSQRGRAT